MKLHLHLGNTKKQHNRAHFTWHSQELQDKPLKKNAAKAIAQLAGVNRASAKLFILYLTACAIEGIHPLDDELEKKIILPDS